MVSPVIAKLLIYRMWSYIIITTIILSQHSICGGKDNYHINEDSCSEDYINNLVYRCNVVDKSYEETSKNAVKHKSTATANTIVPHSAVGISTSVMQFTISDEVLVYSTNPPEIVEAPTAVIVSTSDTFQPIDPMIATTNIPVSLTTNFMTIREELRETEEHITPEDKKCVISEDQLTTTVSMESYNTIKPTKTMVTMDKDITYTKSVNTELSISATGPTSAVEQSDSTEFINLTTPPLLTTTTSLEISTSDTVAVQDVTPTMMHQNIFLPITDHAATIDPTPIVDCTTLVYATTTVTLNNDEVTNTSVVAPESSPTPSLPRDISGILNL